MAETTKGLLEQVLEETERKEAREHGEREVRERGRGSESKEEGAEPEWPHDVEQLMELSGRDLRACLVAISPDDLVCIVGEGSAALRSRVFGELDAESAGWLRDNLEFWDPATRHHRESSRAAVLEVVRQLLSLGRIALPDSTERLGQDQDAAGESARGELLETLAGLVALARAKGKEELRAIADESTHPMLEYGLARLLEVGEGPDEREALEKSLIERQRTLEVAYRTELELIRQALMSVYRGDSLDDFLAKVRGVGD